MTDIIDRAQALEERQRDEAIRRMTITEVSVGCVSTGFCRRCGDEIEEERRQAQPRALRCLECQESVERSLRLHRKG